MFELAFSHPLFVQSIQASSTVSPALGWALEDLEEQSEVAIYSGLPAGNGSSSDFQKMSASSPILTKEADQMEVEELLHKLTWRGEIPLQKWMNFYTKVLARFAINSTLKLILQMDLPSDNSFHGKNWKREELPYRRPIRVRWSKIPMRNR